MTPKDFFRDRDDRRPEVQELFAALKHELPNLQDLLKDVTSHWEEEDCFYRFYHMSFKVFAIQTATERIVKALQALAPKRTLHPYFREIIGAGTGKTFTLADNQRWEAAVRPMLEAFAHAKYQLQMAVRYGAELEFPPNSLPSGWAAFLYLYGLR